MIATPTRFVYMVKLLYLYSAMAVLARFVEKVNDGYREADNLYRALKRERVFACSNHSSAS